jgi:hypothetical protein
MDVKMEEKYDLIRLGSWRELEGDGILSVDGVEI